MRNRCFYLDGVRVLIVPFENVRRIGYDFETGEAIVYASTEEDGKELVSEAKRLQQKTKYMRSA